MNHPLSVYRNDWIYEAECTSCGILFQESDQHAKKLAATQHAMAENHYVTIRENSVLVLGPGKVEVQA